MPPENAIHVLYYIINEDEDNEVHKIIGIYSNERARDVVDRLKHHEGFRHPKGEIPNPPFDHGSGWLDRGIWKRWSHFD